MALKASAALKQFFEKRCRDLGLKDLGNSLRLPLLCESLRLFGNSFVKKKSVSPDLCSSNAGSWKVYTRQLICISCSPIKKLRVSVKPGLWTGLDYGLDWTGLTKAAVYTYTKATTACPQLYLKLLPCC